MRFSLSAGISIALATACLTRAAPTGGALPWTPEDLTSASLTASAYVQRRGIGSSRVAQDGPISSGKALELRSAEEQQLVTRTSLELDLLSKIVDTSTLPRLAPNSPISDGNEALTDLRLMTGPADRPIIPHSAPPSVQQGQLSTSDGIALAMNTMPKQSVGHARWRRQPQAQMVSHPGQRGNSASATSRAHSPHLQEAEAALLRATTDKSASKRPLATDTDVSPRSSKESRTADGVRSSINNAKVAELDAEEGFRASHDTIEAASTSKAKPILASATEVEAAIRRLKKMTSEYAKHLREALILRGSRKVKNVLDAELFLVDRLEDPKVQEELQRHKMLLKRMRQPSKYSRFGIANPGHYDITSWRMANHNLYTRGRKN